MWRLLIVAALAVSAVGCSSVPVDPATAAQVPLERIALKEFTEPSAGKRPIIVKRDSAIRAIASDARFYIDGQRVANIGSGEALRIYLKDGRYKLGVKTGGFDDSAQPIQEINARVADGEDSVFRIYIGGAGFSIQPTSF